MKAAFYLSDNSSTSFILSLNNIISYLLIFSYYKKITENYISKKTYIQLIRNNELFGGKLDSKKFY